MYSVLLHFFILLIPLSWVYFYLSVYELICYALFSFPPLSDLIEICFIRMLFSKCVLFSRTLSLISLDLTITVSGYRSYVVLHAIQCYASNPPFSLLVRVIYTPVDEDTKLLKEISTLLCM